MSTPIGNGPSTPQTFDFQRLQKIVALVEGSPFKTADTVNLRAAPPSAADGAREVIILKPSDGVFTSASAATEQVASGLAAQGVKVDDTLESVHGVTARVGAAEAEALEKAGYRVFDDSLRTMMPLFPCQSYTAVAKKNPALVCSAKAMPVVDPLALTHSDAVQRQGVTGKGQVVAVLDSGFDHADTSLVAWKDFVDDSKAPTDPVGHGTHVAGDILQIAPDAQIVGVRIMNARGQGRPSDIIRGLQWAVENKKKYNISVINMSLGGEPMGIPSAENPIDRAVRAAIKKGITVVSAAGNSGPGEATIGSPADEPLGIAVGAGLDRKTVSDFSSRGPTEDDVQKPDVMAPGEFIVSWAVPQSQMDQMATVFQRLRDMTDEQLLRTLENKPELVEGLGLPESIFTMSPEERSKTLNDALPPIYKPDAKHLAAPGTSFASPIVAGVVANLKSVNPTLTPQRVKEVLASTAESMGAQYSRNEQGAGFVSADKALDVVKG